jgi:hypothetical protein
MVESSSDEIMRQKSLIYTATEDMEKRKDLLSKFQKMSKLRRILIMIFIALVMALVLSYVVTNVLENYESTQLIQITSKTTLTVSNETSFSSPIEAVIEKGYFDSIGEVYFYLYSPYASDFVTFDVWMCRDNSSWVSVPFLNFTTKNYTQMADLGVIELSNPNLTIYQKYYFPPQPTNLPPTVTKQDALNSVHGYIIIHRQATPADETQWFLTFLTVFGAVFAVIGIVLGVYLPPRDSYSNSTKIEKVPVKLTYSLPT